MNNTGALIGKLVLILAVVVSLCSTVSATVLVKIPVFSPAARAIAGLTRVTVSCETPGATIRYTTDGTTPATTNGTIVPLDGWVYVLPGTTLKAKAWATNAIPSPILTASYTALAVNRPYYIAHGSAKVDGDLSDWVDAEWTPLTQLYDVPLYPNGSPLNPATPDIAEAYFATRWTDRKVYVAIKVRDTVHHLLDAYLAWDSCDLVEFCIHTTGGGPTDYNNYGFASAQEYLVGIRPNGNSVWATLGPTGSVAGTGVELAGKVAGQWLCYEAGLIPYAVFGGTSPSTISLLSAGQVIGVDPLVLANNGTTKINDYSSRGYTGMRSENLMTGKFMNYNAIGTHMLVMGGSVAGTKTCADGTIVSCPGVVTAVFGDVFYVESSDRSSGVRVEKSGHGMSLGYAAQVIGVVTTDSETGERYVDAGPGTVAGAYRGVLAPLGMTNRSLAANVGLFIRTTGRVTEKGAGWFAIDDGSGSPVKVVGNAPSGTPYVAVTGANSREKDVGGAVQRAVIATSIAVVAP